MTQIEWPTAPKILQRRFAGPASKAEEAGPTSSAAAALCTLLPQQVLSSAQFSFPRLLAPYTCPTLTPASSQKRRLCSRPRAKPSPDVSLASRQVERERRKLKRDSLRASRAGVLESGEATAPSPTQQVCLFHRLQPQESPSPATRNSPLQCVSQAPLARGGPLQPVRRAPPDRALPHPALSLTRKGDPTSVGGAGVSPAF